MNFELKRVVKLVSYDDQNKRGSTNKWGSHVFGLSFFDNILYRCEPIYKKIRLMECNKL